jgi:membrane fusion protein, copper/silver efflux system
MKRLWKNKMNKHRILTVFMIITLLFVSSCRQNDNDHEQDDIYTCSMHPTVTNHKPGKCPVCGMDLIKRANTAPEGAESVVPGSEYTAPIEEGMTSGVETTKGLYKTMDITLDAQGVVTYDTRFVYTISTRVGGRLEKVTAKYNYQQLQKGENLVEIYSPELITAQREYVFILENENDNSLIEISKKKLRVLGFTDAQITALSATKNILIHVPVYSPYSGYVISSESTPPVLTESTNTTTPVSSGMEMPSSPSGSSTKNLSSATSSREIIREGQYVQSGQALVKIVNADALRIELNLPSAYSSLINKGESVFLNFGNGHSHNATIDFVEPFFSQGQEFLKVRVYTRDVENMHIGHLVDAQIQVSAKESLWVPRSSVVHLGVEQVVFVKKGEIFKPQKVSAGIESEDWIQIKSGLTDKEILASNASYLVDSESLIRVKE